jgi:hypothetical protein
MSDFDGEAGAVENVKNEHYVAMPKSWEARNNKDMNQGMGYGNMADLANTPYPPTKMEGAKRNVQLAPEMPPEDDFNYNANRGK